MRARSIKPGICDNEILGTADPFYSLLFERLWMMADREGRLEDRPLRIKAQAFPYREGLDIEALLTWLAAHEFIRRYVVAGQRYIQVIKFLEHQKPHQNEKPSVIPAPPAATETDQGAPSSTTKVASEHNQGTKHLALTPSSLTPDSGLLTPDCGGETRARGKPPDVPRGAGAIDKGDRLTQVGAAFASLLEDWRRDVPECNPDAFAKWIVHLEVSGKQMTPAMRLAQARRLAGNGDFDSQAEVVTYCAENGYKSLIPIADVRHRTRGRADAEEPPKLKWRPPPDEEPTRASG